MMNEGNGFKSLVVPSQRIHGAEGKAFPLVLAPSEDSIDGGYPLGTWLTEHRHVLDQLLLDHKAIFFRGFSEMKTHDDFHRFVVSTGLKAMPYVGGAAVRSQLTERVFTANESPPTEKIPFHHELAQTPDPPTHIMFFCETAPTAGGETPLLVSNEIYERVAALHPEIMAIIEQQGVQYIRVMSKLDDPTSAIGRGWQSTFQCTTRGEAEAALIALGSSWEWLANDNLRTITAVVPAVRVDAGERRTGAKTFFNSIVAAYTGWNDSRNRGELAIRTADGQQLDPQFMRDACQLMEEISAAITWRQGDVLLVDNRTTMHSRRSFEGPRRILAAIARDHAR